MTAADTVRLSKDGVFFTLQGEGPKVGVPSIFVRLDTCNLRCQWGDTICDAHYTSWTPSGTRVPITSLIPEVVGMMRQYRCRDVVITGGEPCLQEHAVRVLAYAVRKAGGFTTVETNGTIYLPGTELSLICLSPKLSSSTPRGTKYEMMHERNRYNTEAMLSWVESGIDYYFKFVIDSPEDISEALGFLSTLGVVPTPEHVCFMPQGITTEELWRRGRWIAEECKKLNIRFTPRLQIDLWGNRPGT